MILWNLRLGTAFDAASIVFMCVMMLPQLSRRLSGRRIQRLSTAEGLHLLALVMKVTAALYSLGEENPNARMRYTATAVLLDAVSVFLLAWFILSDDDGRLRRSGRGTPISISMIAAAILPSAIAVCLERLSIDMGLEPGYIGLLGISYAVSLYLVQTIYDVRAGKQLEQREASLEIGQAKLLVEQIHPHFIANSLMSIEELCYTDPQTAAKRIEDFAGYLRGNFVALTSEELIPFETELEHIRQYVALEQADPSKAFEMDYDLRETDFSIPALTVQPIVENAIRHGAHSRTDGSGRVKLSTEAIGRFIRIAVKDNGTGKSALTDKQIAHVSVGVQNVQQRLKKQCEGTLKISTGEDGTVAVMTIPRMEGAKDAYAVRR